MEDPLPLFVAPPASSGGDSAPVDSSATDTERRRRRHLVDPADADAVPTTSPPDHHQHHRHSHHHPQSWQQLEEEEGDTTTTLHTLQATTDLMLSRQSDMMTVVSRLERRLVSLEDVVTGLSYQVAETKIEQQQQQRHRRHEEEAALPVDGATSALPPHSGTVVNGSSLVFPETTLVAGEDARLLREAGYNHHSHHHHHGGHNADESDHIGGDISVVDSACVDVAVLAAQRSPPRIEMDVSATDSIPAAPNEKGEVNRLKEGEPNVVAANSKQMKSGARNVKRQRQAPTRVLPEKEGDRHISQPQRRPSPPSVLAEVEAVLAASSWGGGGGADDDGLAKGKPITDDKEDEGVQGDHHHHHHSISRQTKEGNDLDEDWATPGTTATATTTAAAAHNSPMEEEDMVDEEEEDTFLSSVSDIDSATGDDDDESDRRRRRAADDVYHQHPPEVDRIFTVIGSTDSGIDDTEEEDYRNLYEDLADVVVVPACDRSLFLSEEEEVSHALPQRTARENVVVGAGEKEPVDHSNADDVTRTAAAVGVTFDLDGESQHHQDEREAPLSEAMPTTSTSSKPQDTSPPRAKRRVAKAKQKEELSHVREMVFDLVDDKSDLNSTLNTTASSLSAHGEVKTGRGRPMATTATRIQQDAKARRARLLAEGERLARAPLRHTKPVRHPPPAAQSSAAAPLHTPPSDASPAARREAPAPTPATSINVSHAAQVAKVRTQQSYSFFPPPPQPSPMADGDQVEFLLAERSNNNNPPSPPPPLQRRMSAPITTTTATTAAASMRTVQQPQGLTPPPTKKRVHSDATSLNAVSTVRQLPQEAQLQEGGQQVAATPGPAATDHPPSPSPRRLDHSTGRGRGGRGGGGGGRGGRGRGRGGGRRGRGRGGGGGGGRGGVGGVGAVGSISPATTSRTAATSQTATVSSSASESVTRTSATCTPSPHRARSVSTNIGGDADDEMSAATTIGHHYTYNAKYHEQSTSSNAVGGSGPHRLTALQASPLRTGDGTGTSSGGAQRRSTAPGSFRQPVSTADPTLGDRRHSQLQQQQRSPLGSMLMKHPPTTSVPTNRGGGGGGVHTSVVLPHRGGPPPPPPAAGGPTHHSSATTTTTTTTAVPKQRPHEPVMAAARPTPTGSDALLPDDDDDTDDEATTSPTRQKRKSASSVKDKKTQSRKAHHTQAPTVDY